MTEAIELWRPIPGTHGRYEVSSCGRVRSLCFGEPHVLALTLSTRGYPRVKVGAKKTVEVHRLLMLAHVGPPAPGLEVRHLDGNPLNCTLENLAYGTRAENMADRSAHGRDWNANKTHCPQGHPYDSVNTYVNPKGERSCLTCKRASNRAYARRKRAEARALREALRGAA